MPYSDDDDKRRSPRSTDINSYLVEDTQRMERERRILEQVGNRQFAKVNERDHSELPPPSNEDGMAHTRLNHPELNQRFDGSFTPKTSQQAEIELENAKREQQLELQMRLGLSPSPNSAPKLVRQ